MKEELINDFIEMLKKNHTDGEFSEICLKCGSTDIENSYGGEGGPVTTGAYTAGFDGQHFVKCKSCGNAKKVEFYVSMNGAFGD